MRIYLREEKAEKIRKEGKVPGVIYGPNVQSQKIYADEKEIYNLYKDHERGLFEIDFEEKKLPAILRDVQIHPITNKIIHFDFYIPALEKKIIITIPIEFIGEAPVVKKGGVLNFNLNEIKVESLPQYLPEKITIDISCLDEIGKTIYVKDIKIASEIKVLIEEDTPIISAIKEREEVSKETSTSSEISNV